ncbi:SagB/ThcOx family dehydrogenase [Halioglobus maricola]|uniref:SagB/ThcOx family dehydrogenase n=1 Tax=Halioglobus maricola TaxID=2601894 RepID=A0A5P9NNW2_9GAMM|nr:SagB/ThcOx family dehydrogenase [Halioglobus maricola]QFU77359.1 SagB/ThcOx family dehydrogenase [Halioglobus maricola]
MRVRRARSLVVTFAGQSPVVRNFMYQQPMPVDGFTLELLSRAEEWQLPQALHALYPTTSPATVDTYLHGMVEYGLLVMENTEAAAQDAEYEAAWAWDSTAGLYHFGIQDPPWLDQDQSAQWMHHIAATQPTIPQFTSNEGLEHVAQMALPDTDSGLLATMKKRRSVRTFLAKPVTANAMRDCLYAGLGVTGFLDTQIPGEEPHLPLTMTPSGGARNPYEGYVYVRNVEGLQPGIYHYSALDHSLGLVTPHLAVNTTELFAQQDWTEGAAFAILLVANFERSSWKYPHPNAYRVVLMEAGHIAQNMLLAATELGLDAAPTGAVSDTAARNLLGLNRVRQSLVYSVFVGHGDPQAFERTQFIPYAPPSVED